jgi:hypothetical protein
MRLPPGLEYSVSIVNGVMAALSCPFYRQYFTRPRPGSQSLPRLPMSLPKRILIEIREMRYRQTTEIDSRDRGQGNPTAGVQPYVPAKPGSHCPWHDCGGWSPTNFVQRRQMRMQQSPTRQRQVISSQRNGATAN